METKDLLDEIYPLLQSQSNTAFPEFAFKRVARGWEATTGEINGGKAKGHLYHYDNRPFCFVNQKTGESISLWKYVQGPGRSGRETLEELARLAGYPLPGLSEEDTEKIRERNERTDLLGSAQAFFVSELWSPRGKKILDYLKGRGYTEDETKSMGLGFFPPQKDVEAHLVSKGYSVDSVNKAGLKTVGFGSSHTLAIPYRDPVGRLKGFSVRATAPGVEPKYKLSIGTEKDTLFNLPEARDARSLVVVEGFLDALIATARGVLGVVATGGSALTDSQLETVLRYGERTFTLALDSDEAGQEGTERSLGRIYKKGARAYVVTLPKKVKDPDELIAKQAGGLSVFKELMRTAESGAKWRAKRLLSKHSLQTDLGRDEALREVLAFEETLRDPIDSKDFLDTALSVLKIPLELLKPKLMDYHEKKDRERLRTSYSELLRDGQRLLQEGKEDALRGLLDERLPEIWAKTVTRTVELYTLEDLLGDIANTPEGLKTGYPSLNKFVAIPQGQLTIIAGRPSHGKTTLLMNLLLNFTREDPGKTFLFFSYEESRRQIGLKLLNILSGECIDETRNLSQLEAYLRGNNTGLAKVEDGKAEYKKLVEDHRLFVVDEPYHVDELADTLAFLNTRYKVGAVFVDYIQKVKIKGRYPTRQVELQKVSEKLLETAKSLQLPIILGAQLGRDKEHSDKVRLDNLREAGDIEQDANLVLGLYNDAMQKAQDRDEKLRDRTVDLTVTILKNRNGAVNEEAVLKFDRPLLTITDPKPNDQGNGRTW